MTGLDTATAFAEASGQWRAYCRPKAFQMTAEDVRAILSAHILKTNPPAEHDLGIELMIGLSETFPCKKR